MKNTSLLLLAVFIPVSLLLVYRNHQENAVSAPISSGSTFYLSAPDIEALRLEADSGDKEAAFKLYQHYTFAALDSEESQRWLEKAARLGHKAAQYNLVKALLDADKRQEAIDWIDKANTDGVQLDKDVFALLGNP